VDGDIPTPSKICRHDWIFMCDFDSGHVTATRPRGKTQWVGGEVGREYWFDLLLWTELK